MRNPRKIKTISYHLIHLKPVFVHPKDELRPVAKTRTSSNFSLVDMH